VLFSQNWAYGERLYIGDAVHMDDLGAPPQLARLNALGPSADAVAMYESDVTAEWRAALRSLGFRMVRVYRDGRARAVIVFRKFEADFTGSTSGTSDRAHR
jgi:hypothetical protein